MDNNLIEENQGMSSISPAPVTLENTTPTLETGLVDANPTLLENEAEVEVLGPQVKITPAPVVTQAPISMAPVTAEVPISGDSVTPVPVSPVTTIEGTNVEVVPTVGVTQVEATETTPPPLPPQDVSFQSAIAQSGEIIQESVEQPLLDTVTVASTVTETVSTDEKIKEQQDLITREDCVIRGEHYRISILTERLIRLEYSPNGVFYDNRTQWVQFRNFDKVDFEITQDEKYLVIKTKYFSLSYSKEKHFDGGKIVPSSNLRVELNDTDHAWYYKHPEVKNYKGLFVSLDGTDNDM